MYSLEKKETIKESIINNIRNGKSLNELCDTNNFPNRDTIHKWLNKDTHFYDNYMRAKEDHFIKEGLELLTIADNVGLTREEINKANLQVSTRQWLLSHLMPKYSNKQQTNIQINNIQPVTGMSIVNEIEEDLSE